MANFYDVNSAIAKPNVLSAMQQGMQFGQQQRALREQRADQQQLRSLAPQIQQGDPSAYMQGAAIDPAAASAQLGAGDLVTRRMEPLVKLLEEADARNPQEAQALWQTHGVPFVRQFSQGTEPTTDWAQAKPMLASLKARIEMAKASQQPTADPTGYREAHMKLIAAGHQPGTQGYKHGMGVLIGTEGRAPTGGFGFEEVMGPDGRKRVQRRNPRTGQVEIYDENTGNFIPMGGTGDLGGAPQQAPTINIEGVPQARQQQIAQAVASLRTLGVPDDQIDAFVQQQAYGQAQFVTPSGVPAPRSAILGAGPTEAESEAAKVAAREQAEISFLPEKERIKAEADIDRAGRAEEAKQQAQVRVELQQLLPKVQSESQRTVALIDRALNHPGREAATGASSRLDPRNFLPGTEATNFRVMLNQLRGGTFLQAFQSLKGGGAITQVEGQKAEEAIARLDQAQTDEAFIEALKDLRKVAQELPSNIQEKLIATGRSTGGGPRGSVAKPMNDADYNAIPRGELFIDPDDGKTYRKP